MKSIDFRDIYMTIIVFRMWNVIQHQNIEI